MGRAIYLSPRATCQICAREQALDGESRMVLHGYTRPGDGYTYGRCPGVGKLSYEVTCDDLKDYIKSLLRQIRGQEKSAREWRAGKFREVVLSRKVPGTGMGAKARYESVSLTAEDFAEGGASYTKLRSVGRYERTWAELLERQAGEHDRMAQMLEGERAAQQRRVDIWTHNPAGIKPAQTAERPPLTPTALKLLRRLHEAEQKHGQAFFKPFVGGFGATNRMSELQTLLAISEQFLIRGERWKVEDERVRRGWVNARAFEITTAGYQLLGIDPATLTHSSTRGDLHRGCGGTWGPSPDEARRGGLIDCCSKCKEERA